MFVLFWHPTDTSTQGSAAATPSEEELDLAAARASESAVRDSFFNTPLYARKPRTSSFTASLPFSSSSSSSNASAKMDVADFVK
jgi:hypothetical protein